MSAQGTQAVPAGMTQVSEEEDLQAAEEVRYEHLINLSITHLSFFLTILFEYSFDQRLCLSLSQLRIKALMTGMAAMATEEVDM